MSRSRWARKPHVSADDAALRPAMADLRIAPIRSPADHNAPRSSHSSSSTLAPLRTLDPQPRFTTRTPAILEPPRDPPPSTYSSSSAFQQSQRSTKASRHRPQQHVSSPAKHRSRHDSSVSSSSSLPSSTTSPVHSILKSSLPPRNYTHQYEDDEDGLVGPEYTWREKPPPSELSYSPEHAPCASPRRSTADHSDRPADIHSSPSSVMLQSPTTLEPLRALRWALNIRQEPRAARACGFGERDRRVIDPPPVVQLSVFDILARQLDATHYSNSMMLMHVSLWDQAGVEDCTLLEQPGRRPGGRLMGTMMASAIVAVDEKNERCVFFAFPDLSCRSYGNYRLRFVLMAIDPMAASTGASSPVLAHTMSEVFTVYSAKDFPGMRPSTSLTQALKRQGTAIPVKKGKQSYSRSKGEDQDDDDDDDDDE